MVAACVCVCVCGGGGDDDIHPDSQLPRSDVCAEVDSDRDSDCRSKQNSRCLHDGHASRSGNTFNPRHAAAGKSRGPVGSTPGVVDVDLQRVRRRVHQRKVWRRQLKHDACCANEIAQCDLREEKSGELREGERVRART
jgi:hypothetical protein